MTAGRRGLTARRARARAPGDVEVIGDGDVRVSRRPARLRDVEPGDLFVARAGAQADGARSSRDAIARGAAAVLVDARRAAWTATLAVPRIVVDDVADGARLRGRRRLRAPDLRARGRRDHRAPTGRRRRRTSSAPRSTARSGGPAAESSAPSATASGTGGRCGAHDPRGRRARAGARGDARARSDARCDGGRRRSRSRPGECAPSASASRR